MSDDKRLRDAIDYYRRCPWGDPGPHLRTLIQAGELLLGLSGFAKGVCGFPPPTTKEIDVWRVEYVITMTGRPHALSDTYVSRAAADGAAKTMNADTTLHSCIRITGPHKQTVPCDFKVEG